MLTNSQVTLIKISELDNATNHLWEYCLFGTTDALSIEKQWNAGVNEWAWLPHGFSQGSDALLTMGISVMGTSKSNVSIFNPSFTRASRIPTTVKQQILKDFKIK